MVQTKEYKRALERPTVKNLQKVWVRVHPAMLGGRDQGNKGQTTHFRVNEPNPKCFDLHAFSFYLFMNLIDLYYNKVIIIVSFILFFQRLPNLSGKFLSVKSQTLLWVVGFKSLDLCWETGEHKFVLL